MMSAGLDILTPAGQVTLQHERAAYAIFERRFPGYTIQHTDKDREAPFDGRIMLRGKSVALVETKCRADVDIYDFRARYRNRWLITERKLQRAAACARRERVPLYGFLFFVRGQVLLVKRLADARGILIEYDLRETKTKATVNGGEATRLNAYVDMADCEPLQLLGMGR